MAITQTISSLGTVPTTAAPANFDTNGDAFLGTALPLFRTELNTFATQANALAAAMNLVAAGGAISIPYLFSTATTDTDPTAGHLALDNATQNAATTIRADTLDSAGSDWTAAINVFDDSSSTIKGFLRLVKSTDGTKWLIFSVSALASPSGYKNITVAPVASSTANPFANGDPILLDFSPVGDKGATGATGAMAPVAAAAGTVDAITANFTPDLTLADQTGCYVVCAGANVTTTPTFAPDGLTAHTITARGGAALKVGDIGGAGFVALLIYNLANTRWELLNPVVDSGIGVHQIVMTGSNGGGSTNTKFGRYTTTESSAGTSITYADSATLGGSWTVNDTGKYAVELEDDLGVSAYFGISKNSAQGTTAIQTIEAANRLIMGQGKHATAMHTQISGVFPLTAGDVLRVHWDVSAGSGTYSKLRILRVS